jgi:RNA polymerase sigma-70 factor, ECF subfamily
MTVVEDDRLRMHRQDAGSPPLEAQHQDGVNPELADNFKRWISLVERIQADDPFALEELYALFGKGVRFYICRQLGPQELDDKVHDTFLIVVQAIRRGELRDPERLMGFVRTVVRRQVAASIDVAVHVRREQTDLDCGAVVADRGQTPEEHAIQHERTELMVDVLRGLSRRDRDILTRFYLDEQPPEQICEDMGLSETQFRLLKSRAKARFGQAGRKKLVKRAMGSFLLRGSMAGLH